MNWLNGQKINWTPPLDFTQAHASQDCALLYSGMREANTGRYSFLCLDPIETREGSRWNELPPIADTRDEHGPLPDWIGYFGYELGDDVPSAPALHSFPSFRFTRYRHLIRFDHQAESITHFARDNSPLPTPSPSTNSATPTICELTSNFTRARYEQSVAATVAHIHAGDFYQANITRKFYGYCATAPDHWSLFRTLCTASPAPYSAYIRHGTQAILSSSPECFLTIAADGTITSRPIKGSARRGATPEEDASIAETLRHSPKNHAENLMIVDLMRNDLARVSEPESVRVTEQSGLYHYATIHHLISTITARLRPDVSATDAIRACFPPGSMTGAPKIAAMRWCAQEEQLARGVYSGAIGWLGGGGCDLSVVIRTLLFDGPRFEFQVGGGIVADSTSTEEWQETLTKARGILFALGLSPDQLAAL